MTRVIAIFKRCWKPLLGLNAVVIAATAYNIVFSERIWTASTQLILPDTSTNLDASLGTLGQLKDQGVTFSTELSPLRVQASILTSDDVIRPIWSSDPEQEKFRDLDSYKKMFKVSPIDQSTAILVEVTSDNPELAQQRTQELVKSYQQRLNELRRGTSDSRQRFSQEQLAEADRKLVATRDALSAFQQSSGLVNNEAQTEQLAEGINTLTVTQADIAAQQQAATARVNSLSQRLGVSPGTGLKSLRLSENKEFQDLRQQLSEVETQLAAARGIYTDASPEVQALLLQREETQAALDQQMRNVLPNSEGVDTAFGGNTYRDSSADLITELIQAENESRSLQQQAETLQGQVAVLKNDLSAISTQQARLIDLQRRYDIAEGVYNGIVAQLEQAQIGAFNAYPDVQTLDEPSVNLEPTSPKESFIVLGGLLAALFGSAALISFIESRNTLIKPKDIQEMDAPVLVRIPHLKQSSRAMPGTGVSEIEFQRLASTISLMHLANRRLLVSSATSGEGKTTITIGLATALVELGFRVLVVDGDFHKAALSQRLGYTTSQESSTLPTPIQIGPRFDLLPAVSQLKNKAVEFVARGRFEKYLNAVQARGEYDYIVVDSAPVDATSETALMAKSIQNVLLVLRLGVSTRPMVQETLQQLVRHNAQVIGLAVNGVEQGTEAGVYSQGVPQDIS